ncbi:hypothetical protein [Bacillus cereus group sp. BfR-BA-02730]|nr:hypothetical protein [Bacillus cereus group sp. BfR-BA-02730]MDX5808317.1 hypothetical protein [Bacillus cereus group sp. BfR-BA-02730]
MVAVNRLVPVLEGIGSISAEVIHSLVTGEPVNGLEWVRKLISKVKL